MINIPTLPPISSSEMEPIQFPIALTCFSCSSSHGSIFLTCNYQKKFGICCQGNGPNGHVGAGGRGRTNMKINLPCPDVPYVGQLKQERETG